MEKIDEIVAVDHIGYAVNDMASAKEKFQALGYTFEDESVDALRNVNVCVGKMGGIRSNFSHRLRTRNHLLMEH